MRAGELRAGELGFDGEASLDDLGWADIILIGSPIQEGLFAAPIQRFMEGAGLLWSEGRFANKIVSSFTSSAMTLSDSLHPWGSIIISQGAYSRAADGRAPGGPGTTARNGSVPLSPAELDLVESQARRAVEVARILKRGHAV
jgi:NAD(P)H dehydrogenase (quinone)